MQWFSREMMVSMITYKRYNYLNERSSNSCHDNPTHHTTYFSKQHYAANQRRYLQATISIQFYRRVRDQARFLVYRAKEG